MISQEAEVFVANNHSSFPVIHKVGNVDIFVFA